jgi:hypothetical protein
MKNPLLSTARGYIDQGCDTDLLRATPAIVASYTLERWTEVIVDVFRLYEEKFNQVASRLQTGFPRFELNKLVREISDGQTKGLLLYASSYPFVPLSYMYFTLATTCLADAARASKKLVGWVTAVSSSVYFSIDALGYSVWEDQDTLNPLAKMIVEGDLDIAYWPAVSESPRQFLENTRALADCIDEARRRAWVLILDRLRGAEWRQSTDTDYGKIADDWLGNQLRPLID